jgi:hypothetical protein
MRKTGYRQLTLFAKLKRSLPALCISGKQNCNLGTAAPKPPNCRRWMDCLVHVPSQTHSGWDTDEIPVYTLSENVLGGITFNSYKFGLHDDHVLPSV